MTPIAATREPQDGGLPRIVRPLLGVLGLIELAIGAFQLLAPHSFYTWFPFGRAWVERVGPYDQHLVTDVGELTLALGVILVVAALFFTVRLVQAVLVGYLVQAIPHLIFHSIHREHLTVADNVANLAVLSLAVIVSGALLALTFGSPRRNSRLVASQRRQAVGGKP